MCALTSGAVDYRTFQAIHDLRWLAAGASPATLNRLSSGIPRDAAGLDPLQLVLAGGCRLTDELAQAAHQALVLAATLPEDDPDAFEAATAILLADRLQRGAGSDDLFWHWDAFQRHYDMMIAPKRAADRRTPH